MPTIRKKKPSSTSIEKIDRNFDSTGTIPNRRWVDGWEARRIAVRAHGWVKEARKERSWRRIPERAAAPLSASVQELTYSPTSVFLSFATDSPDLSVRMVNRNAVPMRHMPLSGSAGAELYEWLENAWVPVATAIPSAENPAFECILFQGRAARRREFRLYLPLYKPMESVALGIAPKAKLEPLPAPEGRKPLFFYGTSITQGGCANTAGSDFVSRVGRLLDRDAINFGFSGSGKGEPAVAKLIREVDASVFILDYVANVTPEQLAETLPTFLRLLREKHPRTPVVLMSNVGYNALLTGTNPIGIAKRDAMLRFYVDAKAAGDPSLHYVDSFSLLPPGLSGAYVDGAHPTSEGFGLIAERLAPQLRIVLAQAAREAGE